MPEGASLQHRGCHLSYRVRGRGTPVLLIQGVGVHGDGWGPQVDELSATCQCLAFDNRAVGLSQPRGVSISVPQMAEDGLALADAQGWDSAHIVGHSLGGLVAIHMALENRERVRSLSLICTFARGRDAAPLSASMIWTGLRTRIGSRRARRRAFLGLVMPHEAVAGHDPDALAQSLAPFFGHDLADQPPAVMRQLRAMRRYDATPRLAELTGIPSLVVSAAHDRIAPVPLGRALSEGIPGSRFVEIPFAAHGATIQCAHQVNKLLLDHVHAVERLRLSPRPSGV